MFLSSGPVHLIGRWQWSAFSHIRREIKEGRKEKGDGVRIGDG
jgi:hypothetical protein